jgi:transcriptional regulator with XRE-family HTH domain
LLRVLIAESTRRGDTLAGLAQHIGVSYRRLAQWRSGEADISNAGRAVLQAAGAYLGIPTAYVLCMTGAISLKDFVDPSSVSSRERVRRDIERMRHDPRTAGFVPDSLLATDLATQQFVAFLYRELGMDRRCHAYEVMRSMQLAALGNLQAEAELASLRVEGDSSGRN